MQNNDYEKMDWKALREKHGVEEINWYPESYVKEVEEYLEKLGAKSYTTDSEIGCVCYGDEKNKNYIKNRYGDGVNNVYIVDCDEYLDISYPQGYISGKYNIYKWDIETDFNDVVAKLDGDYTIYVLPQTIIFKKD